LALVDLDDEWDKRIEFQPANARCTKNTATFIIAPRWKNVKSLQSDFEIHTTEQRDHGQIQ
jgi:hypothetical protein